MNGEQSGKHVTKDQERVPAAANEASFGPLVKHILIGGILAVLSVAYIELGRQVGRSAPIPFLLLFGVGVLSASVWGRVAGLTSATVIGGYIVYAALTSFGPPTLTGGPLQVSLGLALVFFTTVMLGRTRDQNRTLIRSLQEAGKGLEARVDERTAALRDSEERLRAAQRIAHIGSFEIRFADDEEWWWSDELFHLFGLERAGFLPDRDAFYALLHSDDREAYSTALTMSLESGERLQTEFRARHSSGEWRHFETIASATLDNRGEVDGLRGTVQDITRRIHEEQNRHDFEAGLRRAQKLEMLGTLAGGIAHDFNNILSAILGYSELAKESAAPDTELYAYLCEVETAALRARQLTTQILTFSRRGEVKWSPIEMNTVVEEALRLLRETIPTTITFQLSISPDCGLVLADATQLHQVIMNLCTNAYHSMRDQGGTLAIGLDEVRFDGDLLVPPHGLAEGSYLRLRVSDTGQGMGSDQIERIFEPYYTTKAAGEGTGLGLATVLGIVKEHGGVITVQSRPGEGATFDVYFPVHAPDHDGSIDVGTDDEMPLPRGKGERILFIDDESAIVNVHKIILTGLGYEVTGRTSSVEAIEVFLAAPYRFDIVITDQTMPGLTGMEVAERVLRVRPNIPIILCTGYSDTIDRDAALAAGIRDYLEKPAKPGELADRIRLALEQDRSDESPQGMH